MSLPKMITLGSKTDGVILSDFTLSGFTAVCESQDIRSRVHVWCHEDVESLLFLLSSLEDDWKGWTGTKSFHSVEGDFVLEATSQSLGGAKITISMKTVCNDFPWSMKATFAVSASQFSDIQRMANSVLNEIQI